MALSRRASLLLPLSLLACSRPKTAEGVAEAFLDAYYVERDHPKALELCDGGAAQRVRTEQKLVAEAGGAYGAQPRVFYKLTGKKPRDGGQELVYTYDTQASRTGITALLDDLARAGIGFKDLQTTQSSLEDIFVDLVRQR